MMMKTLFTQLCQCSLYSLGDNAVCMDHLILIKNMIWLRNPEMSLDFNYSFHDFFIWFCSLDVCRPFFFHQKGQPRRLKSTNVRSLVWDGDIEHGFDAISGWAKALCFPIVYHCKANAEQDFLFFHSGQ